MKRAYWILLAAIVAVAVVMSLMGRRADHAETVVAETPERPITNLSLTIEDGRMEPERVVAPKGNDVHLRLVNRGAHAVHVALAGYSERVSVTLEAGTDWEGAFIADRPGDDFVWLVDGEPAGRFDVKGSHLVEGHR